MKQQVQSVEYLQNRTQKERKGICGEGSGTCVFSTQRITPPTTPIHCPLTDFRATVKALIMLFVINSARVKTTVSLLIPRGEVEEECSLTEPGDLAIHQCALISVQCKVLSSL